MDYPKSVPSVGLVNGRFIDENPLLGTTGSLIPSAWGNAVTDELLSILTAAGIAPSEASTNQVLAALRGSGLFQTAALFNSSKLAATTEFVQQSLGNFSGSRDENGTGISLPPSDVGKYVALALGAAQTVVLPLLTSVPVGSTITLHNPSTFDKIVTVAGDNQVSPNGYTITSVTLKQGDTASFTSEASVWRMHGVGALKYSAQFGVSLTASGWQKLPSGLIIQWGDFTAHATAGSPLSITLPIAYPAACRSVQVAGDGSITSAVSVWVDSVSPVTFNARCNIGGQPNCRFIAIGY